MRTVKLMIKKLNEAANSEECKHVWDKARSKGESVDSCINNMIELGRLYGYTDAFLLEERKRMETKEFRQAVAAILGCIEKGG